eukprot:7290178-Pyramimonas_sp.AAC.1
MGLASHSPAWIIEILLTTVGPQTDRRYVLTADQSDAGSAGTFSRRTNQTQEAQVYSHGGPIVVTCCARSRARPASPPWPVPATGAAGPRARRRARTCPAVLARYASAGRTAAAPTAPEENQRRDSIEHIL